MNGIPRIKEVRSFSQFGISGVTIIFEDGTDIYWARQQVGERLDQVGASIPQEFGQPEMGPIATGLGEIFQFELRNAETARTHARSWSCARSSTGRWPAGSRACPGSSRSTPSAASSRRTRSSSTPTGSSARGIALNQVYEAIRRNNLNAGGGYIQRNGELRVIRGVGLIDSLKDLEEVVLATTDGGTPIYVRDVGTVRFAPMLRQGAATRDGRGEAVTAIVYLLAGENGRVVVDRIKAKVEEIQSELPEGVVIDAYYDRSVLIEKTIGTVARNLAEGGVLVVAVLLILLGDLRAGLIVALAIPLSMLFAGNLMLAYGHRRQPDEPGGDRLRPDRRQRRDRDRELCPTPRPCRPEASRLGRGPPRDAGGPPAGRLRRGDHHDGAPAHPGAPGGRGEDVPADGADGHLRADRLAAVLADGHAGAGLVLPPPGDRRARHGPGALGRRASTSRSSAWPSGTRWRSHWRRWSGSPRAFRWRSGSAASSSRSSTRGT